MFTQCILGRVWLPQTGLFPWECLQLALDLAFSFHHSTNVVLSIVYCLRRQQWYVWWLFVLPVAAVPSVVLLTSLLFSHGCGDVVFQLPF